MHIEVFCKKLCLVFAVLCLYPIAAQAEVRAYACQTEGRAWSNSDRLVGDPLPRRMEFQLFVENGKVIQLNRTRVYPYEEYRSFVNYIGGRDEFAEFQRARDERLRRAPQIPRDGYSREMTDAEYRHFFGSDRNGDFSKNWSAPPLVAINCTLSAGVSDIEPHLQIQFDQLETAGNRLQGLFYDKTPDRASTPPVQLRVYGLYGVHRSSRLSSGTGRFSCLLADHIVRPDLAPENDRICHRVGEDPNPVAPVSCSNASAVQSAKDQFLSELNAKSEELRRLAFRNFSGSERSIRGVSVLFERRLEMITACFNRQDGEELRRRAKGFIDEIRSFEQMSQSIFG